MAGIALKRSVIIYLVFKMVPLEGVSKKCNVGKEK